MAATSLHFYFEFIRSQSHSAYFVHAQSLGCYMAFLATWRYRSVAYLGSLWHFGLKITIIQVISICYFYWALLMYFFPLYVSPFVWWIPCDQMSLQQYIYMILHHFIYFHVHHKLKIYIDKHLFFHVYKRSSKQMEYKTNWISKQMVHKIWNIKINGTLKKWYVKTKHIPSMLSNNVLHWSK